jgi:hypothetical protein
MALSTSVPVDIFLSSMTPQGVESRLLTSYHAKLLSPPNKAMELTALAFEPRGRILASWVLSVGVGLVVQVGPQLIAVALGCPETIMTTDAYLRELIWAYRTEVFGEALYATAAVFTRELSRRRKWQVLAQLETRTKILLGEALDREGLPASRSSLRRSLGRITGVLAAAFPWRLTLWVVGVVARSTVAGFERFEREGSSEDSALLQHLTAHERAQCEFVSRELAGDNDRSLDRVLVLLRQADGIGSGRSAT